MYFSTYGLVWSNIRNRLDVEKTEKLIKTYRFYRAEEDTRRIYSNCSNYSSLFFKSFTFRCCSFYLIKKMHSSLCKCAAYFILYRYFCRHELLWLRRPLLFTVCSLQWHIASYSNESRVHVEQYAMGRRRMEAWRGHVSLCLFKRVVPGAEVPFHHRCRSRQIFRVRRIFPEFP